MVVPSLQLIGAVEGRTNEGFESQKSLCLAVRNDDEAIRLVLVFRFAIVGGLTQIIW